MTETRLIEARYIGRAKDRADGSQTAYAWVDGKWSVAITKIALMTFFGAPILPGEEATLYGTLGIAKTATDDEVRKAYRRMAKQWHPDVSKEPGSRQQFGAVQHAWDILSNHRAKYDAGLALQESLVKNVEAFNAANEDNWGYRSPLRCGYILGEGTMNRGRFTIERIIQWEDIVRADGKSLVSSWIYGDDKPVEEWS